MNADAPNYSLKPPFSSDQFWGKIIELLNFGQGYVTPESFYEIFKKNLNKGGGDTMGESYFLRKGTDWYFSVGLDVQNERFKGMLYNGVGSGFSLKLNDDPKELSDNPRYGWCIPLSMALYELKIQGWNKKPISFGFDDRPPNTPPRPPFFYQFSRGGKKAKLTLFWGYSRNKECIYGITVSATR